MNKAKIQSARELVERFRLSFLENQAKALSFNDGLTQSKKVIESVKRRPILVGIYGMPNSGKSYLIKRLKETLNPKNFEVMYSNGAPRRSTFENDIPLALKISSEDSRNQIYLFHCAWERFQELPIRNAGENEDPNVLSQEVLHRSLDLNIGIYNPQFYQPIKGDYDIVIANSDSLIKKPI